MECSGLCHVLLSVPSTHPGASPLPQDPLAVSVVTQCETLKAVVLEWEEKVRGGGGGAGRGAVEVRKWILPETRQFLATWLVNTIPVRSSLMCPHIAVVVEP